MTDEASNRPIRTCVGCRTQDIRDQLVRVVRGPSAEGEPPAVRLDETRTAPGRGAWIHPDQQCIAAALKRGGFSRAFKGRVDITGLEAQLRARVNPSQGTEPPLEAGRTPMDIR